MEGAAVQKVKVDAKIAENQPNRDNFDEDYDCPGVDELKHLLKFKKKLKVDGNLPVLLVPAVRPTEVDKSNKSSSSSSSSTHQPPTEAQLMKKVSSK